MGKSKLVGDNVIRKNLLTMLKDEENGAKEYVKLLYLLEIARMPIPERFKVPIAGIINDEIRHAKSLEKIIDYLDGK